MKPYTLLSTDDLVQLIADVASPSEVLNVSSDLGSAQTGFCYSSIPNTVALAANIEWLTLANESPCISCIITSSDIMKLSGDALNKPVLVYKNAAESFYVLHNRAIHKRTYESKNWQPIQHIASSANIDDTTVMKGSVTIGENVAIGPQCVVHGPVIIGNNTAIHEHCTIGSEGLFSKRIAGCLQHMSHYGGVSIGNDCQIHTGVNISRSVHFGGSSTLENEVSIGIHANVGHDSVIGRATTLSSKAILLGRVRIGANCWIGASAMVSNGIVVGEGSNVRLGAVVVQDLGPNSDVSGNFAQPHHKRLRAMLRGG